MKRIIITTTLFILLLTVHVYGAHMLEETDFNIENFLHEQIEELDIKEIENMIDIVNKDYRGVLPRLTLKDIIFDLMKGELIFNYKELFNNLLHLFLKEIYVNMQFAIQLLVIAIIMGILKNVSNSFGGETVSDIAELICYGAAVALCIGSFRYVYSIASETIFYMIGFMQAVFPLIITLLISTGNVASGALFHPLILASISIVTFITERVILPAIFLSVLFFLINAMTKINYIKKLASLLRQFAVVLMGLIVTLLSGMTAIKGVISSSADNMLIKTAKFSVDKFIPIVGGYISDSVEMIMSCSALIKNAIGAVGLLFIILIILIPILKLLAISLIYKGLAILIEPLGIENISDSLNQMGNTVVILAAIVLFVAIMFMIMITILISTGHLI
ncbi:MAG: stage III sporulation protein AE [Peptostreptococcales bacterium]